MKKPLHIYLSIISLTMSFIWVGCSRDENARSEVKSDTQNEAAISTTTQPLAVHVPDHIPSDREFIERTKQAIVRYKLTELPLNQLMFELVPDTPPGTKLLNVRERHDMKSGGDPATAPRLFSIRLDVATGVLWTDALSVAAEFEPLPK